MKHAGVCRLVVALAAACTLQGAFAGECAPPSQVSEATPDEVRAYFDAQRLKVVTFLGYSGAGYEHPARLEKRALRVLDRLNPKRTLVNIGATPDGIGAVYAWAKQRGFMTTGIVSSQARQPGVSLSPCVDIVFYVDDATWGGYLPGTQTLSPTSQAMVEVSDRLVAVGGGEVARDELLAACKLGKRVTFIAADMNHRRAIDKAATKGQPAPTDFRGAAHAAITGVPSCCALRHSPFGLPCGLMPRR